MGRSQTETITIRLTQEEKLAMLERMKNAPQNESFATQSKEDGD